MRDFFISYSHYDKDVALEMCEFLERRGTSCWIAPRDIPSGASYSGKIVKAIQESRVFVVILSKSSLESRHVLSELSMAFEAQLVIVPFLLDDFPIPFDYKYYLQMSQFVQAFADYKSHFSDLVKALDLNVGEHEIKQKSYTDNANPSENRKLHIARYEELLDHGLTAKKIAEMLVRNDYQLYSGITEANEGTPELWAEYLSSYPDTFCYLVDESYDIVGNWSFLAVSQENHLKNLHDGTLVESQFDIGETEALLFPGEYIGYLLNLSINVGYNSVANYKLLYDALAEQLLWYAENGIFFKSWYVNVFRKDQEAMYKGIGFKYLCDNTEFGKLYYLEKTGNIRIGTKEVKDRIKELYQEFLSGQ